MEGGQPGFVHHVLGAGMGVGVTGLVRVWATYETQWTWGSTSRSLPYPPPRAPTPTTPHTASCVFFRLGAAIGPSPGVRGERPGCTSAAFPPGPLRMRPAKHEGHS
jgi:hypothetical protein